MEAVPRKCQNRHMSSQWPPPGHSGAYRAEINLEGAPSTVFDLSVPRAREQFDLSTVRLDRHGGASEADLEFRGRLYSAIGAITVAGGHVETAMKRLVLHLKGERSSRFSLVDKTWSDLHKMLVAESRKSTPIGQELAEILNGASKNS